MPIMNKIKTVCVYCGSGPGTNPHFVEGATTHGQIFAENGVSLVYGGGSNGLMGAIAKCPLLGFLPRHLRSCQLITPVG